jgi:hypothetical protein
MAPDTIVLVNTNSVSFSIAIDSISRTAFHTQRCVTVLADYRNVDAVFFISYNCEESPCWIILLIVTKRAYESTDATTRTLLRIDDENLGG